MAEKEFEEYINKVSIVCQNYERWFCDKIGRKA